jgi:hypothetical protein
MKPKGPHTPAAPDAMTAAEIEWLTFGGGSRPRGFELRPGGSALFWQYEMWCWSTDEMMARYTKHQAAVDELARAAAWTVRRVSPKSTVNASANVG